MLLRCFLLATSTALLLVVTAATSAAAADDSGAEFFEKRVRPILVTRCFECHSDQVAKPKGSLRLDSRTAALKGGDTGPALVPGNARQSLLIDAINYGELYQMPPKSKLPAEEIATLTKWVEIGAPWPDAPIAAAAAEPGGFDLARRKAEHWCWQPIKANPPPAVKNGTWVADPLDRFSLARLEEKSLSPNQPADARTLIRRAYFDLVGLPPPAEALDGFADSYPALIDRLLASPHFGERWARHWLDLVRYAESRGHEFDYDIPNAFEYRDYVIRALNADLPYDQFLIEQIAGDLLPQPRLHPRDGFNESIIGTGFWFLGEWVHSPVDIRKDECDRIDNQIDVFSKTFLGLTVACARCHDHKFDAISQRDYYALAGYLQSSSYRLTRFANWQDDRRIAAELGELGARFKPLIAGQIATALRARIDELSDKLAAGAEDLASELGAMETDLRGAEPIVDYGHLSPGGWMVDGPTFGTSPMKAGQIVLSDDEAAPLEVAAYGSARRDWAWGDLGLLSGSQNDSGRLNGWLRAGRTLKTPTFKLNSGYVHYLIRGAGRVYAAVDSHAMINGPLHAELLKDTGGNSELPLRWITHDLSRYVGERVHLEFSPKEDEDFRLLMVVEGRERPAAPTYRPNRLISKVISSSASEGNGANRAMFRKIVESTLAALAADRIAISSDVPDMAELANWLVAQLGEQKSEKVSKLVAEHATAQQKLIETIRPQSRLCMAMGDATGVDANLLVRGNHKTVGPVVPRRMLEALDGSGPRDAGRGESFRFQGSDPASTHDGSGRLELARQLVDRNNPLVSRVIVNRVWQHLMGRGIVPSVDNFGVLGEQPTHHELLDYLADELMRDGWSLKRLIRRIMLSSTYRQRSEVGDQRSEVDDPQNLLFHRQNLKRLEGEAIRDAMLAISGRLDLSMQGPSVPVHLTPFMQGRGRPKESGPLDGAGRRSVYIAVRRNFLSPMMLAFDTPIPFSTIGRRNVSNVPAQALILMNDPFVKEQSRLWARQLLNDRDATPRERIGRMYLAAFYREPTAHEIDTALSFLAQQAREYGLAVEQLIRDERVWADLAHVLFNVKEFLFVD